MEASLIDWGTVQNTLVVQGRCSLEPARLPISIHYLRAIQLTFYHWTHLFHGHLMTVAYISHQEDTRRPTILKEADLILYWAELYVVDLSDIHIPGVENWQVDFPSHQHLDLGKFALHLEVFQFLCHRSTGV